MRPEALTVELSAPCAGWIEVRVASPVAEVLAAASHIYPSLQELCGFACDLAAGRPARPVVFLLEPEELELSTVDVDADAVELVATRFRDHHRGAGSVVFSHVLSRGALALTLWRSLRRLQTGLPADAFAREWRGPFPEIEMAALARLVRRER